MSTKPEGRPEEYTGNRPRLEALLLAAILALSLAGGLLYARLLPPWQSASQAPHNQTAAAEFQKVRRRARPIGFPSKENSDQRIP